MGKKGTWFSTIKKAFTHSSKDKATDGTEKKSSKEKKKKGLGKLKHGDGHSFIPLFRQPSSIEKILGEAEREHDIRNHSLPTSHVTPIVRNDPSPPRNASPPSYAAQSTPLSINSIYLTPPRVSSTPQAFPVNDGTPARAPSPRNDRQWKPEPTLKNRHICATKIQTAFRGYMARRSYRTLRGLERLQGVVKGQSVKRQTANALKCMQMMVRLQTQIQARRINMLENEAQQRQGLSRNGNDLESAFGKWMSENQEDWDDSTLTKEEIEARMQRKFDAIVKRERAMAYAYTHQSWKSTPRIGHGALADFRTGGYPYWWNWFNQRQPPPVTPSVNLPKTPSTKNFHVASTKQITDFKTSPLPQSNINGQSVLGFKNMDTSTPKSTSPSIPAKTQQAGTPQRTPQRISRGSATTSPFNGQIFRDNDSLTSCPSFSVPRYMTPTVSAQAKLKDGKEQFPASPGSITSDVSKRRSSFPLGQVGGSFKWNKGSLFSKKDTCSQKGLGKGQRTQSVGNLSIDSSTSMPASVGRRAFNRFV